MSGPHILIVDDERDLRWVLSGLFREAGFTVSEAANGAEALNKVEETPPDVLLSDVRMPGMSGVDLLRELQRRDRDLPVILLSAVGDIDTAVGAMKDGAYDFMPKPFEQGRLIRTAERAAEGRRLRAEVARLRGQLSDQQVSLGISAAARELERTLELLAPQVSLSVLLTGESGTGKEVVAREIHRRSPVAAGPFMAVDCGALPEPLMESQLFGHRKGAFTGADRERPGLFRMADGGTLFLDELGNLPLTLQAKLLRALQERTVVPVGGGEPVGFDARLICASNADLQDGVKAGTFRIDLFHRVAEFCVSIPPLRERPEDLEHFAKIFLTEANREMARHVEGLTAAAQQELKRHPWPGNLRELRNTIRRGVLLCAGRELDVPDLAPQTTPELPATPDSSLPLAEQVKGAADALEASILRQTLEREGGNKAAAARALKIDYSTLHRKLKRHGLLAVAPTP